MKSDEHPKISREALKNALLLYAVTDRRWTGEKNLYQQVEEAIEGGATFVQLREKNLSESAFEKEAVAIQELCRKHGIPFVVNDNVEIARRMGADGVHVGQSDMEAGDVRALLGPDAILGVSAQTVEQAKLAEERGADYLGVGAVYIAMTLAGMVGSIRDYLPSFLNQSGDLLTGQAQPSDYTAAVCVAAAASLALLIASVPFSARRKV